MPQLDPAPWFNILVFSWLVFSIIVFPKTLKFTFTNNLTSQCVSAPHVKPWTWVWS
nr:ATP synthase F0 subunit 8 [Bryaninops yongei]